MMEMTKEIILAGEPVLVEHRLSRRGRSLRITLHKDGRVILTRPLFTMEKSAENFLHMRASWVLKHLHRYKKLKPLIPHYTARDFKTKEFQALKAELLGKIETRLEHFTELYKALGHMLVYKKVTIRNTKSRWGSCSRKGNLQFSFKLHYVPPHLLDYVIVHELCHLKEFNHGKSFWNLVGETLPNFKELRAELRKVV